MTSLVARGVAVRRGSRLVLDQVDLTLPAGGWVAVTGSSGAGKTTLLHTLVGLTAADSGTVLLDGTPVRAAARGHVALVPQHHGLVALLTAQENVELALQAAHRPRGEVTAAATAALASVGLARRAEHLVDELSGGEQQRVAVARALAAAPVLLVADEPTAELDAENRTRVLAALQGAARSGAIVVLTTDDAEVAERCDRHMLLDSGRLHSLR